MEAMPTRARRLFIHSGDSPIFYIIYIMGAVTGAQIRVFYRYLKAILLDFGFGIIGCRHLNAAAPTSRDELYPTKYCVL